MQKQILAKHPDSDVKVYAVWFSMRPSDVRSEWKAGLLPDSRVTHFWDEARVVGRFFATQSDPPFRRPVQWDAFFVYGPEAFWDEAPTPLRGFGRTVMRARDKLRATLVPLFQQKTQPEGAAQQ